MFIDSKEIGKRIREVRLSKNLKQEEFAESLNISPSSLSELETGKHKPSTEILVKLVEGFEVNLHYILFGTGEMFIDPVVVTASRMIKYVFDLRYLGEFFYKLERSQYLQIEVMKTYIAIMLSDKDRELVEKEVKIFEEQKAKEFKEKRTDPELGTQNET